MKAPFPSGTRLREYVAHATLKQRMLFHSAVLMLFAAALCRIPRFAAWGPESAVLLGLCIPPYAAMLTARTVLRQRATLNLTDALVLSVRYALWAVALPTLTLLLSTTVRSCRPLEGLGFMVLGPGLGTLLATHVAALVATRVGEPRRARKVLGIVWLIDLVSALLPLWSTPAVYTYAQTFGYFHTVLYDDGLTLPYGYVYFRMSTLFLLLAIWSSARITMSVFWFACAAIVLSLGASLGFRSDTATMARMLGRSIAGRRCTVVVPQELSRADAQRLLDDCEYRIHAAEAQLGTHVSRPITAYFFRSAEEKRSAMGAGGTLIAKPWRYEVYLHDTDWPHDVLGHEIAHVVAGDVIGGVLHIPGWLGGVWPNPALTEGIAVALTWYDSDELTPHEWARALLELERMPPLSALSGAGFWGAPANIAYTVSGSFLRFMLDTAGPNRVIDLLQRGTLAPSGPAALRELEARWHAFLRAQPLNERSLALARARFTKLPPLARRCPHVVAAIEDRLRVDLITGHLNEAKSACDELVRVNPGDWEAEHSRAVALALEGAFDETQRHIERLGRRGVPPVALLAVREAYTDGLLNTGRVTEAKTELAELGAAPMASTDRRRIAIKAALAGTDTEQARLAPKLLSPYYAQSAAQLMALAEQLTSMRDDGIGAYLIGRRLHSERAYELAIGPLEQAIARGLPSSDLRHEAARLLGTAYYAAGRLNAAVEKWQRLADSQDLSAVQRAEVADWLARLSFKPQ